MRKQSIRFKAGSFCAALPGTGGKLLDVPGETHVTLLVLSADDK